MFYILLYIVGILLAFQGIEMIIKHFYKLISPKETNFMLLVYLLATMIGFLSIAIITIRKLKKK
jgi:divalent metal cation (Fe/Co/Zn/Cd) transporter